MKEKLNQLRSWSLQLASTKWGAWALFICAFSDASIIGLPIPMIFLAFVLLDMKKAYLYALIGTAGTLLGAVAGYTVGHFAWLDENGEFSAVAQFIFNNIPGFSEDGYERIHLLYMKWDFWILFVAAALPLPFKIFSISSGVFNINLFFFCLVTLISQGIKYTILALLTIKLGPEVKKLFSFNWKPVALIVMACIAVVVVAIRVF